MARTFKEMLKTGDLVNVFALGRIPNPIIVEMFGLAGKYDGFWLDQEHTQLSTDQIINLSLAARANDFDSFVRVPPTGYWQVT